MNQAGGGGGYRYKGVVSQPNGHWGPRFTPNTSGCGSGRSSRAGGGHGVRQRSRQAEDVRGDSYSNLPMGQAHLALEARFQSHFSDDAVLMMIKDGSYPAKLADFSRSDLATHHHHQYLRVVGGADVVYRDYFEKELTPSDVGKLNRLVIPKKYAVKFFPHVDPEAAEVSDAELEFYDKEMRRWRFRYCYWRSSQSFVFTKGWNKFVKDKGLKTKDVVLFYNCETRPNQPVFPGHLTVFSMIDFCQCEPDGATGPSGTAEEEADGSGGDTGNQGQRRVFRLFGVDIM